ncbi:MAG: GAF and ANTAR domain-containing protein [Actinomycetota bacterium]|nr:GAF and ANTAR domain-containing protein [Actinomycetota bacterium]
MATTEPRGAELAETFAEIARDLLSADSVEGTLQRIVDRAVETIEGCDHAGVSLVQPKGISTPAASDEVPPGVDAIQYETDEGPCIDAIKEHEVFRAPDLLEEEERWPKFASRVTAETGVRSMLSFRLFDEAHTLGALNLYSKEVGAFDDAAQAIGAVFAAHAAVALSSAQREEHLEKALESRDVIGQAKGILMARQDVTSDEAFDMLRRASQRLNVKLREVATQLVERESADDAGPGPAYGPGTSP